MKLCLTLFFLSLSLVSHAKTLKIMEYNVENLFDTQHDEGTDDYTYLPLITKNSTPGFHELCQAYSTEFYVNECLNLDWSEAIFGRKILNTAKVIKAFDQSGKGADIIVLEEVENKNALNKLVTKALGGMGYQYQVLIEGDDSRGIDVAVISKYPVLAAKRYPIVINGKTLNTRGILEVTINADGQTVVVYANHWPSQSNPAIERIASAQLLSKLAKAQRADLVIALGDFNTISSDHPYPFSFLENFIDADQEARRVQPNLHPGTHFFKGEWTSLDHIFIHRSSALKADFRKFQIIHAPFMLHQDQRSGQMIPLRFNAQNGSGFSDHLPLGIEFNY